MLVQLIDDQSAVSSTCNNENENYHQKVIRRLSEIQKGRQGLIKRANPSLMHVHLAISYAYTKDYTYSINVEPKAVLIYVKLYLEKNNLMFRFLSKL